MCINDLHIHMNVRIFIISQRNVLQKRIIEQKEYVKKNEISFFSEDKKRIWSELNVRFSIFFFVC